MEPVILRHKDATRQALLYGAFALGIVVLLAVIFWFGFPGKWWTLILVPIALFLVYSTVRLATLRVRLDETGIWEPSPFRLTYVTPWKDVRQVRALSSPGAMRMSFIGVEVVHTDGQTHEIVALKSQAGAAYAEPMVESWIDDIRAARARWA